MNCSQARELLVLASGGDLEDAGALQAQTHAGGCAACREFQRGLEGNQALFRALRQEAVPRTMLTEMHQDLFSKIRETSQSLSWHIRLERALLGGLRRPRYAVACLAALVILSVSLFAQMRHVEADPHPAVAATFEGRDTLIRPESYREWVFVGSSTEPGEPGMFKNVYINPAAYREYIRTGEFPEGTVMVMESAEQGKRTEAGLEGSYEKEFVALQASVKDSRRFRDGWGYFRFTDNDGKPAGKAPALPQEAGCLACHRDRAATDHVFTQFYPVLRPAARVL